MRAPRALVVALVSSALLLAGCGGDDDSTATDGAADTAEAGATVRASLTMDKIEVPDEIAGGIVEVEFESQIEEGELNFTRVKSGTTEDAFKQAIVKAVSGGPIPDFVEGTAGFFTTGKGTTTHTIQLDAGSYIVWSIPEQPDEEEGEGGEPAAGTESSSTTAAEGEGEGEGEGPAPEDVVSTTTTVTAGEGGEMPAGSGTIVAKDYTFDVDVKAGKSYVFRNEGPAQLHHVVLFNFGPVDPAVVEAKLPAFLQSGEDAAPPPEFKDLDMSKFEAGGAGVFTPGGAGTFTADLAAGNTYAAVCFISDRTGGPPHAFGHNMRKVFKVA